MPRKTDHGFRLTLPAIHEYPYRVRGWESTWGSTAGNDRPDFDLVGIGEHFIFRNQVITPNHQMRLDHEIKFAQHFFCALGAFDLDLALGMTQLNHHGAILRLTRARIANPKNRRLSHEGTHFNVREG